jgi:hypothetical protein
MASNSDIGRIRELVEALAKMKLKELLDKELSDTSKRNLYELTGKAGTRKLVQLTGMSAGAISGLWQKWYSMGILTKRGKFYRKLLEEGASTNEQGSD